MTRITGLFYLHTCTHIHIYIDEDHGGILLSTRYQNNLGPHPNHSHRSPSKTDYFSSTKKVKMLSIIKTVKYSPALPQCTRSLSSSLRVFKEDTKDVDQQLFNKNKKKLEKLEHEGHDEASKDFKRPSVNKLKKKGEDAQIKQHLSLIHI